MRPGLAAQAAPSGHVCLPPCSLPGCCFPRAVTRVHHSNCLPVSLPACLSAHLAAQLAALSLGAACRWMPSVRRMSRSASTWGTSVSVARHDVCTWVLAQLAELRPAEPPLAIIRLSSCCLQLVCAMPCPASPPALGKQRHLAPTKRHLSAEAPLPPRSRFPQLPAARLRSHGAQPLGKGAARGAAPL